MSTPEQLSNPEQIPGYSYGTSDAARSPITLDELTKLKQAAGLTAQDEQYLRMAGQVLAPQAAAMVDAWRELVAEHPHLAVYSAHPDGTPNKEYSAASHPRFARWIIDACTRPLDQAWLEYQHEIGLRHTRAKKNQTDHADSPDHIPLRYLLAFTAPVLTTTKDFLRGHGHSPEDIDKMHDAWTKSVLLHVTVWSRAYPVGEGW